MKVQYYKVIYENTNSGTSIVEVYRKIIDKHNYIEEFYSNTLKKWVKNIDTLDYISQRNKLQEITEDELFMEML